MATPLTILFLGANPSDQTRLALTREAQEIGDRLRSTKHRDAFRLEQQWELRAHRFQSVIMRFEPAIVHFSGHGERSGKLVFQDNEGKSHAAQPAALTNVFALLGKCVRCVLLNACYSAEQARAIAQHVDVVVGMTSAIGDADAIAFAGSFYEALGYGQDVATAFGLAKNSITLEGLLDGDVPQLSVRGGLDASSVVLLPPSENPR